MGPGAMSSQERYSAGSGLPKTRPPEDGQAQISSTRHTRLHLRDDTKDLAPEVVEALRLYDLDGTGKITSSEIVAGANALQQLRAEKLWMKKVVACAAGFVVLLLAGGFYVTQAAIETSKEMHVAGVQTGAESDARLVTPGGEEVQAASADMRVGPEGELLQRSTSRALASGRAPMVKLGGHRPLVQRLELDFRRLEESNATEGTEADSEVQLTLPLGEALASLEDFELNGASELRVDLPGGGGQVVTSVDFFRSGAEVTAFGSDRFFGWSLRCEKEAEDQQCSVAAHVVDGRNSPVGRVLQARAGSGAPRQLSLARSLGNKGIVFRTPAGGFPCYDSCTCEWDTYYLAFWPDWHPCFPYHPQFRHRFCGKDKTKSQVIRDKRDSDYAKFCPERSYPPTMGQLKNMEDGFGGLYYRLAEWNWRTFQDKIWPEATTLCARQHPEHDKVFKSTRHGAQWREVKRKDWLACCGSGKLNDNCV